MTTVKELIARQKAAMARDLLAPPPGVSRPEWMTGQPVADPYWTSERHHEASGMVIGQGGGCRWIVVQMAFTNWRLIGCPEQYEESNPEFGWCFNGLAALKLACFAWDPETEDEPVGWHKRAGSPRRAPRREEQPVYNQYRCLHGSYMISGPCKVDQYCPEMAETRSKAGMP